MPYLETDYDKGYKAGKREVSNPILLDPYEAGKRAGREEERKKSGFYFETDYERGFKKGRSDATNPPLYVDPYKAGFEAGKKAANKNLFPCSKNENRIEFD